MRRSRLYAPGRLLGIDLARGLALLGMMSVHIVPSLDGDGAVTWAYRISAGRASALFAVLAGVSLTLSLWHGHSGDQALVRGARRGVLARAGVIGAVGLTLGLLQSGVAVILVHYAVLFAVGALFLGFRARTLAACAAGWLLLSPVAGHVLRAQLPRGPGPNPSVVSLANPAELVTTLVFTGYYPVLQWTGYLLVGLTLGRLNLGRFPLRSKRTALWLVGVGASLAVAAKACSALLLGPGGGLAHLSVPSSSPIADRDLLVALSTGTYGTTPTTSWWWLAVAGPHTGTPLDLLHTTGTALLVIGACLLLTAGLARHGRAVVLPVAAAGSMTLTLYTCHVVVLASMHDVDVGWAPSQLWATHAVAALVVATLWQLTGWRGPLEGMAADASRAARESALPLDAVQRNRFE